MGAVIDTGDTNESEVIRILESIIQAVKDKEVGFRVHYSFDMQNASESILKDYRMVRFLNGEKEFNMNIKILKGIHNHGINR